MNNQPRNETDTQDSSSNHSDKIFLQSILIGIIAWVLFPFVLVQFIEEKGYAVLLGIELGWMLAVLVGYFYYRFRSKP